MTVLRGLSLGTLLLVAAGCTVQYASGPPFADLSRPDPPPGYAVLYVFRDLAKPREYEAYLDVDGEEAVALLERGFTRLCLSPGEHRFVFRWPVSTVLTKTAMPRVAFAHVFRADETYGFQLRGEIEPKGIVIRSRS